MSNLKKASDPQKVFLLGWLPFGLYSFLVIQGAILPPDKIPFFLIQLNDKAVHAAEYFLLFFFALNAFRRAPRSAGSAVLWALLHCAAMTVITELLQIWVPGRSFELLDGAADLAGAAAAWLSYSAWARKRGSSV